MTLLLNGGIANAAERYIHYKCRRTGLSRLPVVRVVFLMIYEPENKEK